MRATAEKTAKPFLKWAGGKGQLIPEIEAHLPDDLRNGQIDTYIEPFVGGGAVFFYIAQNYNCIKKFILLDINQDLVNCFNSIKNDVESLIQELSSLQNRFRRRKKETQKDFYYDMRTEFNAERSSALLIFLNKTCFNGLYRVNKGGLFNVPFGRYENPTICNEDNLRSVSEILQKVEIIQGDFAESGHFINDKTFVYLDPPYRPLSPTASFTSYAKEDFGHKEQVRLAEFCRHIDKKHAKFLLSNSDPKNEDPKDRFFEDNYKKFSFHIDRVKAVRAINCKASGRGQINELLITNY